MQAVGAAKYPLYSMLFGGAVKLCACWILTGQEQIGILGTPISTVLCYFTMAVCNLYFVMRTTKHALPFASVLIRPAAAALVCALTAKGAYRLLSAEVPQTVAALSSIVLGGVVYLALLALFGGLGADVLSLFGGRIRIRRRRLSPKGR